MSVSFKKLFRDLLRVVSIRKINYKFVDNKRYHLKIETVSFQCNKFVSRNALLVFSLSGLFSSIEKHPQEEELHELVHKGDNLLQEGKVVEALDVFTSVIQKAQSSNNEEFVYTIKLKLGVILIELRKYEEAEKLLFEVIDHLDKKHHDTSPLTVVYANYQLGRVYQNLQQISKAETMFEKCYQSLKPKIPSALKSKNAETLQVWVNVLIEYAVFQMMQQHYDRANSYFKEAYDICVAFQEEGSEQTVLILHYLGVICYELDDVPNALEHLNKAVYYGKRLPGMLGFSQIYVTLGNIYLHQGMLNEAQKNCSEGFKNATRHKYEEIIQLANKCLQEVKDVRRKT